MNKILINIPNVETVGELRDAVSTTLTSVVGQLTKQISNDISALAGSQTSQTDWVQISKLIDSAVKSLPTPPAVSIDQVLDEIQSSVLGYLKVSTIDVRQINVADRISFMSGSSDLVIATGKDLIVLNPGSIRGTTYYCNIPLSGQMVIVDSTGKSYSTGYNPVISGVTYNGVTSGSPVSFVNTVTPNSTTIQYKDWAGTNQSATIVTSVTVGSTNYNVKGGCLC